MKMKIILGIVLILVSACQVNVVNDTEFLCSAMKNAVTDENVTIHYDERLCVLTLGEPTYIYMVRCTKNGHYIDFMFRMNETRTIYEIEQIGDGSCEATQIK